MRSKRLTMLLLSAIMALGTVAMTAPAVSADYDEHPNVVVQIAIRLDNIEGYGGNYAKAREYRAMLKDIRHWLREHDDPKWVGRSHHGHGHGDGAACEDAFDAWLLDTRALARVGFVYTRGQATKWQEYEPGWERQAARVRAKLLFNRIESNQEDATEDFIDECLLNMPRRARFLLF